MPARSDLVTAVRRLRSAGSADRPYRHQALLLLWAIGRARTGSPRLARWSAVRNELTDLLSAFGPPENQPTPEYPFVALADTSLWEVPGFSEPVPKAHGSQVLRWLNANDPVGGLREEVYNRLTAEDVDRADIVGEILNRYFKREPADELLRVVGLLSSPGTPTDWTLRSGDVARRKTIHAMYGGQEQGQGNVMFTICSRSSR